MQSLLILIAIMWSTFPTCMKPLYTHRQLIFKRSNKGHLKNNPRRMILQSLLSNPLN